MGRVTRYVYDQAGRLVETINPDGTTTSATYADNQVMSSTDADGYTDYKYDADSNLIQVTDPSPGRSDTRHLAWLRDKLGERFVTGVVLYLGTFQAGHAGSIPVARSREVFTFPLGPRLRTNSQPAVAGL
jgi:YD repeat-containing protein